MPIFSKHEPSKKALVYCPVCDTSLGTRDTGEWYIANCKECRTRFSWQPFAHKPKAALHKDLERQVCGCGRCGR